MKIDDTSSYPATRRAFLGALTAGTFAGCGALRALCSERLCESDMSCIVLWMQGGPSQFESFDPKPEHSNGGPTGVQSTSVPGIQVAEHWPLTAKVMKHIAVIRSMTNREGNHLRAEYQLHTGYAPTGGVRHPALGALVAKELRCSELDLPAYVATGRPRRQGGLGAGLMGFFGARLRLGADIVLEAVSIEDHLVDADLVIVGEGQFDRSTVFNKSPVAVAQRAKKHGTPVIGIAGSLGAGFREVHQHGIDAVFSLVNRPMSLKAAMEDTKRLVAIATEEACRAVSLKT